MLHQWPDIAASIHTLGSDVGYVVTQLEEAPSTGQLHYQGYLEVNKKITLVGLKRNIAAGLLVHQFDPDRIHLEAARGSQKQVFMKCIPAHSQNREYCTKAEGRQAGPWQAGKAMSPGRRTDLEALASSVIEKGLTTTIEENPADYIKYSHGLQALNQAVSRKRARERLNRECEVVLLIGRAGAGKTRYVFDKEGPDLYDQEPGSTWFDGYDGQEAVLLDDFAGAASGWRLDYLLRFLDRYRLRLPVKGNFTYLEAKRVYVTTNIHPFNWFGWKNRWEQYSALMRRFTKCIVFEGHVAVELTSRTYIEQVVCWPHGPMPGTYLGDFKMDTSSHDLPTGDPGPDPDWIVERLQ